MNEKLIALAILGGALFLLAKRSQAAIPAPYRSNTFYPYMQQPDTPQPVYTYDSFDTFQTPDVFLFPEYNADIYQPNSEYDDTLAIPTPEFDVTPEPIFIPAGFDDMPQDNSQQNVNAFLAVIREIESNNNYNSLVGGGSFSDYADHPANLGWTGMRREDGRLTTAAGAYQIVRTTWNNLRNKRLINVPDFTPQSQDIAAIALIRGRGALTDVMRGNFNAAIMRLPGEWEAFQRILAGNYPYTLPQIQQIYMAAGGRIADTQYV